MESRTSADDDKDLALVQSQGFLQHLHASFLGVRGKNAASKLEHTIWELVERLLRRVPVLVGLIKDLNAQQSIPGIQTHISSLEVQMRSMTTQQPLECNEGPATLSTESEMVQCEEDSDSDADDDSVAGDLSGATPISLKGIYVS
ncbi:hypothetical protein BGZ72_008213 [Mortierella alpina]|nr:hypothetical protein BGZ72_008213 [Mortierella alpina]